MIAVTPINDIKEHDDYSTTCECCPSVEFENGEMIIIHNSFDGRENPTPEQAKFRFTLKPLRL